MDNKLPIEAAERQEPVATVVRYQGNILGALECHLDEGTKLYTTPQPAPAGMVLVKRSDLVAALDKTMFSSCGFCRDISLSLAAMLAAAPKEMK